MGWNFDATRPIYSQLIEQLQCMIVSGAYAPGSRLSSVRDLANEASVNPNTMQRALSELEKQSLIYTERTSGRYVTENEELISMSRKQLAVQKIDLFIKQMQELGFKREETIALISETAKEEKQ